MPLGNPLSIPASLENRYQVPAEWSICEMSATDWQLGPSLLYKGMLENDGIVTAEISGITLLLVPGPKYKRDILQGRINAMVAAGCPLSLEFD